jgi:hypothetical protein
LLLLHVPGIATLLRPPCTTNHSITQARSSVPCQRGIHCAFCHALVFVRSPVSCDEQTRVAYVYPLHDHRCPVQGRSCFLEQVSDLGAQYVGCCRTNTLRSGEVRHHHPAICSCAIPQTSMSPTTLFCGIPLYLSLSEHKIAHGQHFPSQVPPSPYPSYHVVSFPRPMTGNQPL